MALKKKLTKEEYDKLSDAFKAEYMTDGDGYKLDLSDDEDTGPLKRALEREKANSATSKKRLAEVEEEKANIILQKQKDRLGIRKKHTSMQSYKKN